jgi:4-amino-4-deoxy-L-arabinose transferase-like glycosyltransferase
LILAILLLINTIPRLFFLGTNSLWWDETVYLSLGKNILEGKYKINLNEESFRSPFLPFLVATSFLVDGEMFVKLILIIVFTNTGIIATYYLGKTLYDKEIGCLASAFIASFPLYIFFGQKILTETIFVTFSTLALMFFYLGIEKSRKYLYLCGVFSGLSFLTKYFGMFLWIFYLLYILFRKKLELIFEKETWVGVLLFLLTISPWAFLGVINYKNPVGGMIENIEIFSSASHQPFHFFFINAHLMFGFSILLVPIALYFFSKEKNKPGILLLISTIVPLLIFSFAHHKEARYLISFAPSFAVSMAYVIKRMKKKTRTLAILLVIFFILQGFFTGYNRIYENKDSSLALKLGALFLRNLTKPDEFVMSESYPYINYYAERISIRPPRNKETFYNYLKKYNITYVLVYVFEPGNPDYLLEELNTNKFEEISWFSQWNQKAVVIYKVRP